MSGGQREGHRPDKHSRWGETIPSSQSSSVDALPVRVAVVVMDIRGGSLGCGASQREEEVNDSREKTTPVLRGWAQINHISSICFPEERP